MYFFWFVWFFGRVLVRVVGYEKDNLFSYWLGYRRGGKFFFRLIVIGY